MSQENFVSLDSIRRRLDGTTGRRYWKSLEELAESPGFLGFLQREFPEQASEWSDPNGRRDFLKLMGASMALAGLTACTRQPDEMIVPYVKAPEEIVPGRPLFFATAVPDQGYAQGVLVESHMGRPTKIEGNPDHPASLGATDVFGQAHVLGLYDPDRSQTIRHRGEIRAWGQFVAALHTALAAQKPLQGEGIRILTGSVTSPTLAGQIDELLQAFPRARWHQWEPTGADNALEGTRLAFGEPVGVRHDLGQADVIVSLEADFMSRGPSRLRDIRQFAERRRVELPEGDGHGGAGSGHAMNRLYVVEASPSITGASADHRLPMRSSQIEGFARALAAELGLPVAGGAAHRWVGPLAADLRVHAGRGLVIAGESQPPAVHALAHAINEALGNVGTTVVYTEPIEARPENHVASLTALADDMEAGRVDLLLVLSANPVYDAPADLRFGARMSKVPLCVHLGLYDDETAERCHWHVPEAHSLEAWSDARAFDGTVSLIQPLIAPLYDGKSAHEMLAVFGDEPDRTAYQILRQHWSRRFPAGFEASWRRALHDGTWPGTAAPARSVSVSLGEWASQPAAAPAGGLEVVFRPDPTVGDGRYANLGWLQELPKPLTKLTWDNAAFMSARTAEKLGVTPARLASDGMHAPLVELKLAGATLSAAAWVQPGHADDCVTVHLGYGRRRSGRVGDGNGFDAYALRGSAGPWFAPGLDVVATGGSARLACTQDHWSMDVEAHAEAEKRHLIRAAPVEEFLADPHMFQAEEHEPSADMSMFPPHSYERHAWGLTIDLSSCVGCNACVVACQSENNIPVVGRDQVARGREMHWIRVDRYFGGSLDEPEIHHQPVTCMQCENAPCELVCPVAATVHSDEGLNDMVYNRCVGTRYCSNNCPYKVRRFNFFLYQDWDTPSLKLQRNPDVTVRSRGVMEKCTYCVQRINKVRIDSRNAGRPIRDGEITTACEQACPAQAITFGDVNDPASRVSRHKAGPRNYGLLTELNTRPRTTYLAALKNPNPEIPRG